MYITYQSHMESLAEEILLLESLKWDERPSSCKLREYVSRNVDRLFEELVEVEIQTMKLWMEEYGMSEQKWIETFAEHFRQLYDSWVKDPKDIHMFLSREYDQRKFQK